MDDTLRRLQEATEVDSGYRKRHPFPHIHLPDLFDPAVLEAAAAEIEERRPRNRSAATKAWHGWQPDIWFPMVAAQKARPVAGKTSLSTPVEVGRCSALITRTLQSAAFVDILGKLTGLPNLIVDPAGTGAGVHNVDCPMEVDGKAVPGGFLAVHIDFSKAKKPRNRRGRLKADTLARMWRRANVILFLNRDWEDSYGGHFEIWGPAKDSRDILDVKRFAKYPPLFNSMVIFTAGERSWHGHPQPLACPPERSRKSFAFYYYSSQRAKDQYPYANAEWPLAHSTIWLPNEQAKARIAANATVAQEGPDAAPAL